MKCEASEEEPFSFEGPEIYKCEGMFLSKFANGLVTDMVL